MPVSHIGLTVSHLPTSTSFFLSALQPLGYRYIGQSGNQIGFGIQDADFFLCQETPGIKAGAAHIAFTAPSRTAVRDFYTAALTAGGRPNGAPATRCDDDGHFNAAVLDLDGNSIEVVFRNGPDMRDDGTVIEHSRVITWQRSVHERYESYRDDRSVISSRTSASRPAPTEVASKAGSVVSKAPSVASKAGSIARSVSEPIAVPQATASDAGDGAAKKIIGTLLGAAAGAAVAYAMVSSERDSAKKESDFSAFMEAKNIVKGAAGYLAQASSQPQTPLQDPQPTIQTAPPTPSPESVHRNIDVRSYHSSTPPQPRSVYAPQQIEAPPTYYSASHVSRAQEPSPLAIEYAPAYSVAPSQARSRLTATRSVTSPELLTIEKARSIAPSAAPHSVVSKARSVAHSAAPSSLISSFVPDHEPRRVSEGSVHSHHSSRSKAKSTHSSASRHTSHSKSSRSRHEEAIESSPSPPPAASRAPSKAPSKAASIVSSILGRDAKSSTSKHDDFIDDLEIEEVTEDDMDTVVPSDSISQIGSTASRRHRKKKHSDSSSSVSKHSSSSKHSRRSHKSRSHHDSDDDGASQHSTESKHRRKHRPSVVSEPSDASTVKPVKPSSSRKDSVTQGQYDGLFDEVKYGTGSVAALPVRGITPSMVSAAGKNKTKTVVRHDMAQKARLFEG
ncbi:hypothetical protein FB567DRAFT_19239 [Paraphoma chrysanthemicola]|uniref:VOC domain-containing protein n=1 Tax=Paraphoma chrysanthemicola TaxID=798071 RepID=A0A8K0RHQ8_9PLEO|nr:hypothetical protein FB567DRAFT_19239 [Paraphoma chrysanthemicola]